RWLRHDLGGTRVPPVEELVHDLEALRRRDRLGVRLVAEIDVRSADDGTGGAALTPDRERGYATRLRRCRRAVVVDVVGDPGGPVGRAVELALHQEGTERVRG